MRLPAYIVFCRTNVNEAALKSLISALIANTMARKLCPRARNAKSGFGFSVAVRGETTLSPQLQAFSSISALSRSALNAQLPAAHDYCALRIAWANCFERAESSVKLSAL